MPHMLMNLINTHPEVKRWFIDTLKVTALQDGAPGVKQLHENPVTATTSVANYLEGDFNNPAAYPDAVISIDGQKILVHKRVVAKACKVRSNLANNKLQQSTLLYCYIEYLWQCC